MTSVDPRAIDDRLYRHLVETVRDYAIFLLNPQGIISSWNQGAERLKQYRAEEIIGRHFSVFYPPEQIESGWPQEELRRASSEGRFEDEGWRLRRDGSRFWANVVITAIRDDEGRLIGFSKVTRDLSERRMHEERLRESEASLRMLVEGVHGHALFLLSPTGRIESWNAGAERLFGHRAEDVIGQPVEWLYRTGALDSGDHRAGRPVLDLAAVLRSGHHQGVGWCMRTDAQAVWAEVTTTALPAENGRPRALVQIVRDLSEQARVRELEAEGRRLHDFIAMLSHELRNPLAPLRHAARLILSDEQSPDVRHHHASMIERQTAHLARLVDDLLDISRVATGKIQLAPRHVDLCGIARRAAELSRPAFQRRHQTLALELNPDGIEIIGDETRLTQVVDNLLSNATKFTDTGGHIALAVGRHQGMAVLTVRDDGVGMTDTLLASAFDPFVQGADTLARSEGGLGVGLALVKRIVELHGGQVHAESAGPGQGSGFTVRLPLATEVREAMQASLAQPSWPPPQIPRNAPSPATPAPRSATQPERVLIVDDNRDAADSLAALLELEGFDVRAVHDGLAAVSMALEWRPEAIVLDIGLPGLDGYSVATQLRERFTGTPLRLIALTGYGQSRDRERSRSAGFDRHLVKPVEYEELVAALRQEDTAQLEATRSQR